MRYTLAIDQGTTSSRAILFDRQMHVVATAQQEFTQHFPASGWVEHDGEEIWQSVLSTCCAVIDKAGIAPEEIAGIGITNQRETTVLWDRKSGQPIANAIVWQDRRTAALCSRLKAEGQEPEVTAKTGLLLDPYFSATKLRWLLDQVPGTDPRDLAFGTIDSFLIWRLTDGQSHKTDATNAARTMLYDIHQGMWSEEMCALFDIPMEILPEVMDCAADFGTTDLFGAQIPILGVAGDQQAATIGQACFAPGMMKSTYGTGCFALLNTGATPVTSQNRLLTTIAYQLDGQATYALEGSIFIAGAVVQWLRDGLGLIEDAAQSGALAMQADPVQTITMVPAFTGLGAPYWEPDCRGAIFGLTRNTGPADLAHAALDSVAFQTRDLLEAMTADWTTPTETVLRVDGGMAASDWTMQRLADVLGTPVDRPAMIETTALGAAWLAGMRAGLYPGIDGFAQHWAKDRRFTPALDPAQKGADYARWQRAVQAAIAAG